MMWHLARAHRRMLARSDAGLLDLGLTSTQAGALFCFRGEEGLLVGEFAQALDIAQSAASGLAARLIEAGLLMRTSDEADGRAARLKLTPRGAKVRAEAARRANAANARMIEGFTDREIAAVVRWLAHIADMETTR